MKKYLFLFITICYGQSPNFFYTYLTSGVTSTDTTFNFTASDTNYVLTNAAYYATIWDTKYANAAEAFKENKAEIILVNSRTLAAFDVERGQYGTTARSFNTTGRRYKISVDVFRQNLVYVSDTSSFTTTATRKAIYLKGVLTSDKFGATPRDVDAGNGSESLPVAGDLLKVVVKTDSIIILRAAGTTSGLKFEYSGKR